MVCGCNSHGEQEKQINQKRIGENTMGIRFILGRAGSGKTERILEEIRTKLMEQPKGSPMILLVPEQGTFQAEHALITTPGLNGLLRAQVLSFRRLAWRVMQESGMTAGTPIDETGKKMLLQRILQKHQEEFKLFHTSSQKMGFIDNLNSLMSEFGRYCLSPEMLQTKMEQMDEGTADEAVLRDKLNDLMIVHREFEIALSSNYLDGEAYLSHLAVQMPQSSLVKGAQLWVDGFHGFTPQEAEVIAQAMAHFQDVTITLCLDRPYRSSDVPPELDLFHPTARTMIYLQRKAEELGLGPATYEVMESIKRFENSPMLAHLERVYEKRLLGSRVAFAQPGDDITIYAASNRRAEVEGAAREIIKLVRDGGLHYRDIAVRVRNIESYGDLLATTFSDYGIPYFMDQKRTVLHHPLVEFIRSALEVILNNWRFDAVFRCIKTDLLLPLVDGKLPRKNSRRIKRNEMDELENLVLAYGIQGYRWTDTKAWNFSRYASMEDETPVELDPLYSKRMDHCRRTVSRPLKAFQKRMKGASNVKDQVEALYLLLEEVAVTERLQQWSEEAFLHGRPEKSKEHAQIFDNIMDMLDQMVDILGEEVVSADLFRKLIETGLESIRQGLVPPALDQVLVGSIDRTRSAQVKVAMVLGVNDGVMPKAISESGIISEAEREALTNNGTLQLADSARRKLLDEQYLIYTVLCSPSHRLWISYPLADEEGMTLLASEVIKHMKNLFPYAKTGQLLSEPASTFSEAEQAAYIASPGKALSYLLVQLKQWMQGEPLSSVWFDVYNWFLQQDDWKDRLAILTGALGFSNEEAPLPETTSLLLYGDHLQASVSRMERFVACPFQHFAANGLRLKERRIFRLEAPDIGQLYHAALSGLYRELHEEKIQMESLTPEMLLKRTATIVERLTPRLQGEILDSSNRYRHIARKLTNILGNSALALLEHAKHGEFRPVGLELGFGPNEALPPLRIDLPNGRTMDIIGRIDRVDEAKSEKGSLLRVIDYKSSSKQLNLDEVYHGLSLQMLTYLDVAISNSEIWLGTKSSPAGVLYFHVHNPMILNTNPLEKEMVDKEVRKQFKMKGLVLADKDTVQLMDKEMDGHSDLIPVGVKKDGSFYSNSSVASEGQLEKLQGHVRETIGKIGTEIMNGKVDISPSKTSKKSACDFCSFKPVCKFDQLFEKNQYQTFKGMKKDDVWQSLYDKETAAEPKLSE
jgi:ATP-dependent helicase/nuclease subunit B